MIDLVEAAIAAVFLHGYADAGERARAEIWPWTLGHNLAVGAGLCEAHGLGRASEWFPGCGRAAS